MAMLMTVIKSRMLYDPTSFPTARQRLTHAQGE
jgi:hypothetical protein